MPAKHTLASFLVINLSVVLAFSIVNSSLVDFSAQIAGLCILSFIVIKTVTRTHLVSTASSIFSGIFLTLILVSTTNGLHSPFFFLIYFLLFYLTLLTEPLLSLLLTFLLIPYFLLPSFLFTLVPLPIADLLPLASLPFITPLAIYLGHEHIKASASSRKIHDLEEKTNETTLWLTTSFRSHLTSLKQAIQSLNFSLEQRLNSPPEWKTIKEQVKRLEKVAQKLKDYLEATEDV